MARRAASHQGAPVNAMGSKGLGTNTGTRRHPSILASCAVHERAAGSWSPPELGLVPCLVRLMNHSVTRKTDDMDFVMDLSWAL